MAKRKFTVKSDGHFYATSIAEWRTETDPEELIKAMKAGGFNFTMIFVPLPADADYSIENYVPVVEGCIKLADYKVEE